LRPKCSLDIVDVEKEEFVSSETAGAGLFASESRSNRVQYLVDITDKRKQQANQSLDSRRSVGLGLRIWENDLNPNTQAYREAATY
jgi:hypothetical protein